MIFNIAFVIFIISFSIYLEFIWTSDPTNPHIPVDLHDKTSWGKELTLDIPCETFTSRSSGSKSSKIEKRIRKYEKKALPIDPEISEQKIEKLREYERELLAKGKRCRWEKFKELTIKDAKNLCIDVWIFQTQKIQEINAKLQVGVIPDCEPSPVGGPGDCHQCKPYKGHFQYLDELEDKLFLPDVVRCNCAYVRWIEGGRLYETISNSKKYFLLHKKNDTMYYVLTTFGQLKSKYIKLVDVYNLSTHESL